MRSYHNKCLKGNQIPADAADFLCPECIEEQTADEASTTKTGKKKLDLELLKKLLEFALNRMGVTIGVSFFIQFFLKFF